MDTQLAGKPSAGWPALPEWSRWSVPHGPPGAAGVNLKVCLARRAVAGAALVQDAGRRIPQSPGSGSPQRPGFYPLTLGGADAAPTMSTLDPLPHLMEMDSSGTLCTFPLGLTTPGHKHGQS